YLLFQWQTKPKSDCFLAYRSLMGAIFGTSIVSYVYRYFQGGQWFIYLTNWGFLMCGVSSITGAVLTNHYHRQPDNWEPPRRAIKFYWACWWSSASLAFVISLTYWTFIYPSDRNPDNLTRVSDFYNILTHAVPPVYYVIDLLLAAQPARLMHFIYPLGTTLVYLTFSFVYYLAGGEDLNGRRYIYKFLNYARPKRVGATIAKTGILVCAASSFLYGVYRLRMLLASEWGFT
ncbi:hypothetical protein KR018_008022, partial [Drosophila ironensis]